MNVSRVSESEPNLVMLGLDFGQVDGLDLLRKIRSRCDAPVIILPATDATIAFLDAPERPLSREYLLQATRMHEDVFDRSIDVQVLRLRRKLEIDPSAPRVIRTERGIGYAFALPVERI
jgi:DNA-binding response OmpR family regulator